MTTVPLQVRHGVMTVLSAHRRLVGLAMLALMSVLMIVGLGGRAFAGDDPADYSLYKAASSAAGYFNAATSPDKNQKGIQKPWDSIGLNTTSQGGDFLGFPDKSNTDIPIIGWAASLASGSSITYSYDSFYSVSTSDDDDNSTNKVASGMANYADFGATLSGAGLDSMKGGFEIPGLRLFAGGLVLVLYLGALAADKLWTVVLEALKFTNPWAILSDGVNRVMPGVGDAMHSRGSNWNGPLAGVAKFIGDIYYQINNLSWAVLAPFFIAMFILMALLWRRSRTWQGFRKILVYLAFITIGVPLLGVSYTGAIDQMSGMAVSGTGFGATRAVAGTYVDFGKWASQERLKVPAGATIEWDNVNKAPSSATLNNIHSTAVAINNDLGYGGGKMTSSDTDSSSESALATLQTASAEMSAGDNATAHDVLGMLGTYIAGDVVTSSQVESEAKEGFKEEAAKSPDSKTTVDGWFAPYSKKDSKLAEITDPDSTTNNPVFTVKASTGLTEKRGDGASGKDTSVFSSQGAVEKNCSSRVQNGSGKDNLPNCNMSLLSIYNFLNTHFDSRSMTVYSSEKATSGITREYHYAVTQVGTGPLRIVYWFSLVSMLLSFVVVSFVYLFSVLFTSLRRSFGTIASVFAGMFGSMYGIARALIYGTSLIVEVFGTVVFYRLFQAVLMSGTDIIEVPLRNLFGDPNSAANNPVAAFFFGGYFIIIMTLIMTVFTLWTMVFAIRYRKEFTTAMTKQLTTFIDKLVGVNEPPPMDKPGLPARMASAAGGGAASGLGMAGANAFMGDHKRPSSVAGTGGNTSKIGVDTEGSGRGDDGGRENVAGTGGPRRPDDSGPKGVPGSGSSSSRDGRGIPGGITVSGAGTGGSSASGSGGVGGVGGEGGEAGDLRQDTGAAPGETAISGAGPGSSSQESFASKDDKSVADSVRQHGRLTDPGAEPEGREGRLGGLREHLGGAKDILAGGAMAAAAGRVGNVRGVKEAGEQMRSGRDRMAAARGQRKGSKAQASAEREQRKAAARQHQAEVRSGRRADTRLTDPSKGSTSGRGSGQGRGTRSNPISGTVVNHQPRTGQDTSGARPGGTNIRQGSTSTGGSRVRTAQQNAPRPTSASGTGPASSRPTGSASRPMSGPTPGSSTPPRRNSTRGSNVRVENSTVRGNVSGSSSSERGGNRVRIKDSTINGDVSADSTKRR